MKKITRKLGKQTKEASDETKKLIIQAALKVFGHEGFHNAKLRDIASIAGIRHNLIRHHFGSKDDLWKAAVDFGLKMREDRIKQIIETETSEDPVKLFKTLIESHIVFTARHTEIAKILLHDNSKRSRDLDYILYRQQKLLDIIEPIFKKVQKRGYFKDFDHDSFSLYMRAISETPIATSDLSNALLKEDIRSEKGIALHTQRVINFLFHKNE